MDNNFEVIRRRGSMLKLKDLEITDSFSQDFYDSFNNFIISGDLKIFGKLLARIHLFDLIKEIPGDIVECGVFKGSGIFTFLKLKRYYCPNTHKKVIGFDYFDSDKLISTLEGQDKNAMSVLFNQRNTRHDNSFKDDLISKLLGCGFADYEFDLIEGDISTSSINFVESRPGFRISLLYLDLDLDIPTYDALSSFWDRVSSGGIIVFDEFAYHDWSESNGVDRFLKDKNVQIKSLNFFAPTAYVIKP